MAASAEYAEVGTKSVAKSDTQYEVDQKAHEYEEASFSDSSRMYAEVGPYEEVVGFLLVIADSQILCTLVFKHMCKIVATKHMLKSEVCLVCNSEHNRNNCYSTFGA